MIHYYFQNADYETLINGYEFGANNPPFLNISSKHYITDDNWNLWVSSKPNNDYVLTAFPEFSTIDEFVEAKFQPLTQSEFEAHKADLSNDHAAFIQKEQELCKIVFDAMATELQKQLSEGVINQIQGIQLQELFSKQHPITLPPELGGLVINIPVIELLIQNRSLGISRLRMSVTPIDVSIGFTQELKDKFLAMMDIQISNLHA